MQPCVNPVLIGCPTIAALYLQINHGPALPLIIRRSFAGLLYGTNIKIP